MTTVSIPGFIVGRTTSRYDKPSFMGMTLSWWDWKPAQGGDTVLICPHVLTFDVPAGFDPRPDLLKELDAQQRDLDAKYAAAKALINQKRSALLAIEHEAA